MKLKQFRIQGYRCIHDTGVVSISDASTLIGKNESGKTAILKGLACLNKEQNLDDQDICDELVDRLCPEDRIIEGRFELTSEERAIIHSALPGISQLDDIVIYRTRGAKSVQYDFPGAKFPKKSSCNETAIEGFRAALEQLSSTIPPLIDAVIAAPVAPIAATPPPPTPPATSPPAAVLSAAEQVAKHEAARTHWDAAMSTLTSRQTFEFKTTDSQFRKLLDIALPYTKKQTAAGALVDAAKKAFKELFVQNDYQQKAEKLVAEKLHPKLLYFPEYKVIDGIINIADYIQSAGQAPKRSDTGYQFEKAETVRNLFHLAQLDPAQLESLATQPSRLASELNRCSDRLTHMLALTWKSKKIDVRLQYTNGTITVEVGDIYNDGTTKNKGLLDRRSAGFKWHFSFFVNFRAGIQQSSFKDAILLLDEPGLNLHPEQQAGLVEVIRELAETNQVVYTTHSPFMIHNFETGSLLTVEFDPESKASKIKSNFWDGDWQTIRPILHAIGDKMLLRVFRGVETFPVLLIVEGATDQRYLTSLSSSPESADEFSPPALGGAEPIPAGGHAAVKERSLHFFKRKRKVLALFDSEPDASAQAEELAKKGFPKEQIVVLLNGKEEADIEDIFSEEDYLNAVNGYYGRKLRDARSWVNVTKGMIDKERDSEGNPKRIIKVLEKLFATHAADGWGKFDKTGVCESLCDRFAKAEFKLSKRSRERIDELSKAITAAAKNVTHIKETA